MLIPAEVLTPICDYSVNYAGENGLLLFPILLGVLGLLCPHFVNSKLKFTYDAILSLLA